MLAAHFFAGAAVLKSRRLPTARPLETELPKAVPAWIIGSLAAPQSDRFAALGHVVKGNLWNWA